MRYFNKTSIVATLIFILTASTAWAQDDAPVVSGPDDEAVDADGVQVVDPERNDPVDPDNDDELDPEEGDSVDPDSTDQINPDSREYVDPDEVDTVDPEEGQTVDPDSAGSIDPDQGGAEVDPDTRNRRVRPESINVELRKKIESARALSRQVETRIDELQDRARTLEPGQEALTTQSDVASLERDVGELTVRFQELERRLREVGRTDQADRVEAARQQTTLLDQQLQRLGVSIQNREGQREAADNASRSATSVSDSAANIGPIRPTARQ